MKLSTNHNNQTRTSSVLTKSIVLVLSLAVLVGVGKYAFNKQNERADGDWTRNKIVEMGDLTTARNEITTRFTVGSRPSGSLKVIKHVASWCNGDVTTFEAKGYSTATLDLAKVRRSDLTLGPANSVTIVVPRPKLNKVVADVSEMNAVDESEGICTKVFSSTQDELNQARAAKAELQRHADKTKADLQAAADKSARQKLEDLAEGLGFNDVNVVFAPSTSGFGV
jgi:hypothetical protein